MMFDITIKNIINNKKRYMFTLMGYILSTALLIGLLLFYTNASTFFFNNFETNQPIIEVSDITEKDYHKLSLYRNVEKITRSNILYNNLDLTLYGMDSFNNMDIINLKITEGKLPTSNNEIIVRNNYLDNFNLNIGNSIRIEGKNYTIVGTYSGGYYGCVYPIITLDSTYTSLNDTYIKLQGITGEQFIKRFPILNQYDIFIYSDEILVANSLMVVVLCVFLLVPIFISILQFRYAFLLSYEQHTKMYGMLQSIGATSNQIKRLILNEGILIALIGSPIGVIIAIGVIYVFYMIVNYYLPIFGTYHLDLHIDIKMIIIGLLLSYLTIYLSMLSVLKKNKKSSIMSMIKNNSDIQLNHKHIRRIRWLDNILPVNIMLARKNVKRYKSRYRFMSFYLAISQIAVLTMITVGGYFAFDYLNYKYNVRVRIGANSLVELEEIKQNYDFDEELIIVQKQTDDLLVGYCENLKVESGTVYADSIGYMYEVEVEMIDIQGKQYRYMGPAGLTTNPTYFMSKEDYERVEGEEKYFNIILYTSDEKMIDEVIEHNPNLIVYETDYSGYSAQTAAIYIISQVFIYSFVFVIVLIIGTNLLHTIYANIKLRNKELCIYESIGLATKELKKFIVYEYTYIHIKSLLLVIIYIFILLDIFSKSMYVVYVTLFTCIVTYIILRISIYFAFKTIDTKNLISIIKNDTL